MYLCVSITDRFDDLETPGFDRSQDTETRT